jgi:hypothetical protein
MTGASRVNMNMGNRRSNLERKGATLWSWLRAALAAPRRDADDQRRALIAASSPTTARPTSFVAPEEGPSAPSRRDGQPHESCVLLAFPIRGEASLVKLAAVLRRCVLDHEPDREPLLLTISRCPRPRLSIDHAAYVESYAEKAEYRISVEASPRTRISVKTTDFDAIVDFVAQYIATRELERAALGAAS